MSDKNAKDEPKYESPILVPLGAMAKGSGVCSVGSSVVGGKPWSSIGSCTTGACFNAAYPGITDCTPGYVATQDCTQGDTANRDCTDAGTCALRACTAGEAALSACTGGTSNIGLPSS
jgi:hypothetical protein